jgi:HEAT repeat protein
MPWLIDWLQSNDPNLRRVALYAISPIGPSASAAVPVLARFMDDSDPDTRYYAVSALACIGTSTNGAMPALIQATERNAIPIKARGLAAWALGRMGPVAKAGVPGVKRLLESTYSYPRIQAEIALWRIDSEATMIPLLVAELEKAQDVGSCDMILLALAETGAPVEAVSRIVSIIESPEEALPQFARSAQFARSNLAQHARQVLSKIDPEAATKIGRAAP